MAIIEPMGLDVDVSIVGVKDYPFDDTKPAELTFSNARKDMLSIQQQISKKQRPPIINPILQQS